MRPIMVDAFCSAGGATKGYQRAGFYVIGIDIKRQPHYCGDEFYQMDAMELLGALAQKSWPLPGPMPDAIHASPPCQDHSTLLVLQDQPHGTGWMLAETRRRLIQGWPGPWVIENVGNAARSMRTTLTLHGGMFGLGVHRLRRFESNILILAAPAPRTCEPIDVTGTGGRCDRPSGQRGGIHRKPRSVAEAQAAMGIDWMTRAELNQAIPPAYTEYIGRQLLEHLAEAAA